MAYFYVDAATGADSLSNGGSWATACASLFYLLNTATANPAAGDTIYMRANASETTKDTTAGALTIATAGTVVSPIKIIGVVTGTTNAGASVVAADLAVKTGDQPVLELTGAGNDLTITGVVEWSYCRIDVPDRIIMSGITTRVFFEKCDIDANEIYWNSGAGRREFIDCDTDLVKGIVGVSAPDLRVIGGTFTAAGAVSTTFLYYTAYASEYEFIGVDLSAGTFTDLYENDPAGGPMVRAKFRNCKMPATYDIMQAATWTADNGRGHLEMIGCHSTTSLASGLSYQEYHYENAQGICQSEETIVRTGGADDGASGSFSYKLTPHANSTLTGSRGASIKTPWMRKWVGGGTAITLTAYFVNDDASGDARDYNRGEAWLELLTPDSADTAQHDFNIDDDGGHVLDNATAITDDTGSTWTTVNTYKQKLSVTVTPGYTGFAYGRVVIAKGPQATPDNVYVDAVLEQT